MRATGVPTADSLPVARAPCVVKVDGLAAGKGVWVCRTGEKLDSALKSAARAGGQVVIEQLLEGVEVSVFAVCDGTHALPLAPARDFKRLDDGDVGPTPAGWARTSPVPAMAADEAAGSIDTPHARPRGAVAARNRPSTACSTPV